MLNCDVYDKLIAHHFLLSKAAVIGVKHHFFKFYSCNLVFHPPGVNSLFNYAKFLNQVSSPCKFVDYKEHVANIHVDTSLQLGLESYIPTHCLPVTVEGQTYKFTLSVNHRTS